MPGAFWFISTFQFPWWLCTLCVNRNRYKCIKLHGDYRSSKQCKTLTNSGSGKTCTSTERLDFFSDIYILNVYCVHSYWATSYHGTDWSGHSYCSAWHWMVCWTATSCWGWQTHMLTDIPWKSVKRSVSFCIMLCWNKTEWDCVCIHCVRFVLLLRRSQ